MEEKRSPSLWNNWGGLGSISQCNLQSQVLISPSLLEVLLSGWWRPHFPPSHFIATFSNLWYLENFRKDKIELNFYVMVFIQQSTLWNHLPKALKLFPMETFSLSLLSKTTVPHWIYYSWHACPRQWRVNKIEEMKNNGASLSSRKSFGKHKGN